MFSTKFTIKELKESKTIDSSGKTLQVRYIVGLVKDKKVAFKLWNDLTTDPKLILDKDIDVEFKIESREHNSNFFTDLTITKIL
ncbi:DUF3127 domain-containing protein [Dyadobacter alkalitolerans]|uniref:DUF3127 domain-containing protein n=1 Tax=Dyadobacter alkalitolerans TaxID=492736 RepID=UPI00041804CF|nr:DUF3127 domain-containing protein [Dyadobacter alkalitolerans]